MLTNYLEFLRSYFSTAQPEEQVTPPAATELSTDDNVDDNEILRAIVDLDRQHQTENYLPIFHLRKQFPSLSREKLDKALYRLQKLGKIDERGKKNKGSFKLSYWLQSLSYRLLKTPYFLTPCMTSVRWHLLKLSPQKKLMLAFPKWLEVRCSIFVTRQLDYYLC